MINSDVSGPSVVLCLSGGGLRATLFHLGLIRALRTHTINGVPALRKVTEIYSVSGGSIMAAHLIKNWEKYNAGDDQFSAAEAEILKLARSNIRDRIMRRWVLLRIFGGRRTHWLRSEYERILGKDSIEACYKQASGSRPPKIRILATSFNTGELCSFAEDDFEIVRRKGKELETIATAGGHLPLSYAVAASSAFPPMFPPIPLTHDMLGHPEIEDLRIPIHLSDGGVYDNLGLEKFRLGLDARKQKPDFVIVSNASASFRTDPRKSYAGPLSRNIRTSDVLMRRVAESTEDAADAMAGIRYVPVRIGATVADDVLPIATQERLRAVRTDLDRFSPALASLLIDHGYRVGACAFAAVGWPSTVVPTSSNRNPSRPNFATSQLEHIATVAADRSFRSLFLDVRDWKTLPVLWLIAISLSAGIYFIVASALEARSERQKAELAESNKNYLAKTIEPMQKAYADKQFDRLGALLGVAVRNAEVSEENPGRDLSANPVNLSGEEARRIADEKPVYTLPRNPASYDQLVFIQFAGVLSRAQITALNQALREAGWKAQSTSGERTGKAAGKNEIRYSGDNEAAAKSLAGAITSTGITAKPVVAVRNPRIPANSLEVWISR